MRSASRNIEVTLREAIGLAPHVTFTLREAIDLAPHVKYAKIGRVKTQPSRANTA